MVTTHKNFLKVKLNGTAIGKICQADLPKNRPNRNWRVRSMNKTFSLDTHFKQTIEPLNHWTTEPLNQPVYSGKQTVSADFLIFSSKRSFLLRNRIMEVSVNHLLLQMESNSFKLSCIRFYKTETVVLVHSPHHKIYGINWRRKINVNMDQGLDRMWDLFGSQHLS